jgi:hypothetical protein
MRSAVVIECLLYVARGACSTVIAFRAAHQIESTQAFSSGPSVRGGQKVSRPPT